MKEKQNYSNHTRYYFPHHFVFYPAMLVLFLISISKIFTREKHADEWISISAMILMVTWLSFMLRQHYALNNQNRIVRLEMRLRYFQLTRENFESKERLLSIRQIAALRFASDEELVALIEKTISENLPPKAVKKSIANWIPDHMRV